MINTKYNLIIPSYGNQAIRLYNSDLDLGSNLTFITFVLVAGSLADDFKVVSDGRIETFSYRLETLRFLMTIENRGLLRIPSNYFFFDCKQLNVAYMDRYFEFNANKEAARLSLYCRYNSYP